MARTWPSLSRPATAGAALAGNVLLAAMLGVTLAFSSSDATPNVDPNNAPELTLSIPGDYLAFGEPFRVPKPVAVAPRPKSRPMPTAPPVQILIPLLDVHRAVEKVGADRFGVMDLPTNSWNAGWFKYGPVPGAPGDAVIEGHAGYPGQPMLFGRLATLKPGDKIIVVLADGSRRLFLVVSMRSVPAGSAPPGLADPYGPPRLTLVTCAGHFDKKRFWYSERLLVETRYAGVV